MAFLNDPLSTTISLFIIGLLGISMYSGARIYVWFRDRKNKIHAQQETPMGVEASNPGVNTLPVDGTIKITKQNEVAPIA